MEKITKNNNKNNLSEGGEGRPIFRFIFALTPVNNSVKNSAVVCLYGWGFMSVSHVSRGPQKTDSWFLVLATRLTRKLGKETYCHVPENDAT